ncbi:shikimate dehydrogenase [Helicobacter baculiformis]|uniref:Shikimate dehydrogenase (NADP(+)) n=1 Tax=Helicobacter baculiformis TaxID=427351 RepID=A0ABV7ZJV8_9HELI|nr:shikimate dehydrogenase [Helicobacter baculiformis]
MKTKLFGVFGNPIIHSKSPALHNKAFADFAHVLGFQGEYRAILLQEGAHLKEEFVKLGLSGANITAPFKEIAYSLSDAQQGVAKELKALNTWVLEGGRVVGYNTDVQGFYAPLEALEMPITHALVIGAGGSARAVAHSLRAHGVHVSVVNRSVQRLNPFKAQGLTCFISAEFAPKPYDLVVNATSAGMDGVSLPLEGALLHELLRQTHIAYDLIYSVKTPFLQMAQDLGVRTLDGKAMLIAQAALSFGYFCAGHVPYAEILESMQEA